MPKTVTLPPTAIPGVRVEDVLSLYREGDTYIDYHRRANGNDHIRVSPWVGGRRRVAFVVPLDAPALLTRALGTDKVKIRDFHRLEAEAAPPSADGKPGGLARVVMLSTPMLWIPGDGPDLHIATVRFECCAAGEGDDGGVTLTATVTATADALKWLVGLRSAVEGLLLRQCEGMARSFIAYTAERTGRAAAGRPPPAPLPDALPAIALPPPLRPLADRPISLPATPAAAAALQDKVVAAEAAANGSGKTARRAEGAAMMAALLDERRGAAVSPSFSVAASSLANSASGISDAEYYDAVEEEYTPSAPLAGSGASIALLMSAEDSVRSRRLPPLRVPRSSLDDEEAERAAAATPLVRTATPAAATSAVPPPALARPAKPSLVAALRGRKAAKAPPAGPTLSASMTKLALGGSGPAGRVTSTCDTIGASRPEEQAAVAAGGAIQKADPGMMVLSLRPTSRRRRCADPAVPPSPGHARVRATLTALDEAQASLKAARAAVLMADGGADEACPPWRLALATAPAHVLIVGVGGVAVASAWVGAAWQRRRTVGRTSLL